MNAPTRLAVFRHIGFRISVKPAKHNQRPFAQATCRRPHSDLLASISIALDPWNVWRRNLASVEFFPIDFVEPRVREDISGTAVQVAEALGKVADEQVFQQFLGGRVKVGGVADFAL